MAEISRVALFGKLNSVGYRTVESSTVFCKLRGNPYVELVHWIHQLLEEKNIDLIQIIYHFELDNARLARDIIAALDRLPQGATSITDLSSYLEQSIERAWSYATLMFGASCVRTGHVVIGILKTSTLRNVLIGISREFEKIKVDLLVEEFEKICEGSGETNSFASDGSQIGNRGEPGEASGALSPAALGKQDALKRFTVDLTEQARNNKLDPIVGRDDEIRQVIDILMRRRQNNPILTGEAGVGKTAVVEGFAQRVVEGNIPPMLKDVSVKTLDVGLLQAGASMKGEFENRLRQVIEEVQSSEKPIILFIDEAHTLVGAGGAVGTGDAANLLKPALARGTLRTIAATTWAEYKKHIEKDPALTRRFQVVQVHEPSEEKALLMLRGVASTMEKYHRVQILDEALEAAVKLSHRYIPARQLPDKSISLLDTACARVAISQHAIPPAVEDSRKRVVALKIQLQIINRESVIGIETKKREADVIEQLNLELEKLSQVEQRWSVEKDIVNRILDLRSKLREASCAVDQFADNASNASNPIASSSTASNTNLSSEVWLTELRALQETLVNHQGETPLILPIVDYQAVASVVQDWTGVPVGKMVKNEIENILNLATVLSQRIIGQNHALEIIAKRVQTSRAQLDNPDKPIGVFMLAGSSGVGKTETALALAEALYGGEQNIITINMSEYQEAHTVSALKGAPPGYVGYGEGGVLTEAVRRRPYSVILLDEIEKAHSDVHEVFFQVFDKGWMEDGEGRIIDFKNTLIILTTNVGTDQIVQLCKDPKALPNPENITKALRAPLLKVFPPALLGRLVVVPYYPLDDDMLCNIINLQLDRIAKRVYSHHKVTFTYTDQVVFLIADRCTELESGGRMIDTILTNTILPKLSSEFLNRMLRNEEISKVHLTAQDNEIVYDFG